MLFPIRLPGVFGSSSSSLRHGDGCWGVSGPKIRNRPKSRYRLLRMWCDIAILRCRGSLAGVDDIAFRRVSEARGCVFATPTPRQDTVKVFGGFGVLGEDIDSRNCGDGRNMARVVLLPPCAAEAESAAHSAGPGAARAGSGWNTRTADLGFRAGIAAGRGLS